MSEYLDRNQVIDLYEKYHPRLATCVYEFGQELRKLPIVERPRGEWKETGFGSVKCSVCGHIIEDRQFGKFIKYCCVCGADMRKERG